MPNESQKRLSEQIFKSDITNYYNRLMDCYSGKFKLPRQNP